MHATARPRSLLRHRDGHEARVGFAELFFDLIYVFAVTQLSHLLLGHLSREGALQTLVLWFAVWLGWQYTCWVTNWLYFDTSSQAATETIVHSKDPGRLGAYFHAVHVIIVGGVIVSAVANDLIIDHPHGATGTAQAAVLLGGPAIYLVGNAFFKRAMFGRLRLSHLAGLAGLVALLPLAAGTDGLQLGALVALLLVIVAGWEALSRRAMPRVRAA